SLLAAWADVAPTAETTLPLQVAKPEDFLWLGTRWSLFALGAASTTHIPRSPAGAHLAQLDALNQDAHVLREGWVFLTGSIVRDGVKQPVMIPLISRPVRLSSESIARATTRSVINGAANGPGSLHPQLTLKADGEAELIPLIDDLDLRADLLEHAEFGRGGFAGQEPSPALVRRMPALWKWVEQAAHESGLAEGRIALDTQNPLDIVGKVAGVRAVVGGAVYAAAEAPRPIAAAALKSWSQVEGIAASSFGTLYPDPSRAHEDLAAPSAGPTDAVLSPFVLSPSQQRVVAAARTRRLTVVSGAPGNGKTHAVAAVALDHVARGQSVLVATRSRFAARSIADLIHRVPGPNALRFGDIVEGSSVVDELNDHLLDAPATDAAGDLARARAVRDAAATTVRTALELEALAADAPSSIAAMRVTAPRCFDLDADLDELDRLTADAQRPRSGPLARWRSRRALGELSEAVGTPVTDPAAVATALAHARRRRAAIVLAADGGTVLADEWDRLAAAQDALHLAVGAAAREQQDRGRRARGAVAELLAALRAGRGKRRQLLASIDAEALTAAVPLWVGTLSDIEDLLPARTGTFDLVILDEAAHIDQLGAAPALLRAKRAVVVGDPRQLRHVSFLADGTIATAMAAHGVEELTATIDLRRNSVFDRAAALVPITELAEHYRSVPHLVEFPLTEFYRGRVDVMTRRPDNDAADVIDVLSPPEPGRPGEIDAVLHLLRERIEAGLDVTVGVITPFREHADALRAAVLKTF
ncbi:MAG: AAA domain-containing protein, partial [Aquihabitans sp.]